MMFFSPALLITTAHKRLQLLSTESVSSPFNDSSSAVVYPTTCGLY